jgi:hypothetical protein
MCACVCVCVCVCLCVYFQDTQPRFVGLPQMIPSCECKEVVTVLLHCCHAIVALFLLSCLSEYDSTHVYAACASSILCILPTSHTRNTLLLRNLMPFVHCFYTVVTMASLCCQSIVTLFIHCCYTSVTLVLH